MPSENAKNAAKEVIRTVRRGEKVVMGDILENLGYAKTVVRNPKEVTKGKEYQKQIAPFARLLESEISKIQLEMAGRDISKERYSELARVLDTLYKNKQLATGGATENVNHRFDPKQLPDDELQRIISEGGISEEGTIEKETA